MSSGLGGLLAAWIQRRPRCWITLNSLVLNDYQVVKPNLRIPCPTFMNFDSHHQQRSQRLKRRVISKSEAPVSSQLTWCIDIQLPMSDISRRPPSCTLPGPWDCLPPSCSSEFLRNIPCSFKYNYTVLAKMESCLYYLKSKYFQWEKRDL